MEKVIISNISKDLNYTMISLRKTPMTVFAGKNIVDIFTQKKILIDLFVENKLDDYCDVFFTISKKQSMDVKRICDDLVSAYPDITFDMENNISKITLSGVGLKSHSKTIKTIAKTISENNLNIKILTLGEIYISYIVDEMMADMFIDKIKEELKSEGFNVNV